jgi:hypothetical protein
VLQDGAAAAAHAAAPPPRPVAAAHAVDEQAARTAALDALCLEFAEYDRELLAGMVEDQGGDAREVTLMLRRIKRQAQNSKRRTEGEGAGGAAKRQR